MCRINSDTGFDNIETIRHFPLRHLVVRKTNCTIPLLYVRKEDSQFIPCVNFFAMCFISASRLSSLIDMETLVHQDNVSSGNSLKMQLVLTFEERMDSITVICCLMAPSTKVWVSDRSSCMRDEKTDEYCT